MKSVSRHIESKPASHSQAPFFAPIVQPKLTVNQPGDEYEREADAVADQVMRMPTPLSGAGQGSAGNGQGNDETTKGNFIQRKPIPLTPIQRKCAECEKEEKEGVQRKEKPGAGFVGTDRVIVQRKCAKCEKEATAQRKENSVSPSMGGGRGEVAGGQSAPSIVSDVLSSGGGRPLDGDTRGFMESRFGQDFSQVRIHTDSRAAESAAAIHAKAYTSGRDVVFGAGEYQPGSDSGRRLLAHELVHVGQQDLTTAVQRVSRKCDDCETEEEEVEIQRKEIGSSRLLSVRFQGTPILEEVMNNSRLLSTGSSGEGVTKVQQALLDLGYPLPKYGADGQFGSETVAAVQQFQSVNSLAADGLVGPKTLGLLDLRFITESGGGPGQGEDTPGNYIVPDAQEPANGQMRKSDFIGYLEQYLCARIDEALAGTLFTAANCPVLHWFFNLVRQSNPLRIEQLAYLYAPEAHAVADLQQIIGVIGDKTAEISINWAATGELTGLPAEIAGRIPAGLRNKARQLARGETSENMLPAVQQAVTGNSGLLFKTKPGGAVATHSPQTVMASLGEGQPLSSGTRNRMEGAFGTSFAEVQVHTDDRAVQLNREMNARAFTVGNHIAFGSQEHQPGNPVGDALMAHELAHVVQQREANTFAGPLPKGTNNSETMEEEADRSAIGVVSSLWGGIKERAQDISRKAMPRLKSGLKLQSCPSGHTKKEKDAAIFKLIDMIGQPDTFETEIISTINDMGDDASEVLMHMTPFSPKSNDSSLYALGGTEAGQRVMTRAAAALNDGNRVAKDRAKTINKILAERKAPDTSTIKPEVQQNIDRINKAIDADPRKQQYLSAKLPIRLPVQIYRYNMEMMGGVYFDPNMPSKRPGDSGITTARAWTGDKHPPRYPLIYIRLGPLALTDTDANIRSVMWHEFQHYKQDLAFREPESSKSANTKILEAESNDQSKSIKPNIEIEATSIQLADDFKILNDDEAKTTLLYLADFMNHADTLPNFKKDAIDRIRAAVSGDKVSQARLVKLIKGINNTTRRNNLKDLSDAIQKDMPPPPKKGKK